MAINKYLRYVVLGGIFIIPFIGLIVANSLFFPFITGKGFFFRIIVEIVFGAWLVLAVTDSSYRPKKSWIAWGLVGFVAIMAIADALSVNAFKSFWSNYERMEGWVTLAHLLAYFFVVGTVFTRELWDRFLQTWIGVGIVTIAYSLLQTLGYIRINQGGVRTDATFGNASYLAIFSVFIAFILLTFLVRESGKLNTNRHAFIFFGFNVGFIFFVFPSVNAIVATQGGAPALVAWLVVTFLVTNILIAASAMYESGRYLYGLIALGELFVIYNTQTRGSILGLIAGLGVAGLLIALLEKKRGVIRTSAISVVIAAVILVVGFIAIRNTSFVQNSPTLNRFASISLSDATTESRFILWGMGLKGFTESPKTVLIGWGQESFNYIFNKYYDPRLYSQEQWFDRAHNVFFDWLTAGGIFGLGSYLFFFGAIIWYIWKKGESDLSLAEKSILTGVLVAYFVNNTFVFDNIVSYILYITIGAYVYSRKTHLVYVAKHQIRVYENRFLAPLGLILVIALVYFVNVPALRANKTLISAITPQQGVSPYPKFTEALAINSFGRSETREQLYSITSQLITGVQQAQANDATTTKALQQFITLVSTETDKQLAETPNDARYYVLPSSVFDMVGDNARSIQLLERAVELSPKKQTILYQLASSYLSSGNTAKAEELLKKAYELETENQYAKILYATGALYNKHATTAAEILKDIPAEELAKSDQIIRAYYFAGQYQQYITLLKTRVSLNPQDLNGRLSLAQGYLLLKDKANAIAEIRKVIEIEPNFKEQGEMYIKQIQDGTLTM